MKITVSGGLKFSKLLVEICIQLEKLKHQPIMHEEIYKIAEGKGDEFADSTIMTPAEIKKKYNTIKWWDNCIKNSDAILICNFDRDGIKNHIGGNAFLEMGSAYVNNKKIFLLNPIPDESYKDEIEAMEPIVINNDLTKII